MYLEYLFPAGSSPRLRGALIACLRRSWRFTRRNSPLRYSRIRRVWQSWLLERPGRPCIGPLFRLSVFPCTRIRLASRREYSIRPPRRRGINVCTRCRGRLCRFTSDHLPRCCAWRFLPLGLKSKGRQQRISREGIDRLRGQNPRGRLIFRNCSARLWRGRGRRRGREHLGGKCKGLRLGRERRGLCPLAGCRRRVCFGPASLSGWRLFFG